jgi:hypothetical protein
MDSLFLAKIIFYGIKEFIYRQGKAGGNPAKIKKETLKAQGGSHRLAH